MDKFHLVSGQLVLSLKLSRDNRDSIISSKCGSSGIQQAILQTESKIEPYSSLSQTPHTTKEGGLSTFQSRDRMAAKAKTGAEVSAVSMKISTRSNSSNQSNSTMTSRSPSIRTLGNLSIVHKRLARINTLHEGSPSANITAYATPPRTPPPEERSSSRRRESKASSTRLSRRETSRVNPSFSFTLDDNPSPSDTTTELAQSPTDPWDIDQLSEVIEKQLHDNSTQEHRLNAVPRQISTTKPHYDTTTGSGATLERLYKEPSPSLNRLFIDMETSLRAIKAERHDQNQSVGMLEREIKNMHKEMKIAFQQPPLPIPQLDDLGTQMNALANTIQSGHMEVLHPRLERLEELIQALINAKKSDGEDRVEASIPRAKGNQPAFWEDMNAQLPLVLETVKQIQLQFQNDKALPNVPVDNEGDTNKTLPDELKNKLENIESLIEGFKSEWKATPVPTASFDPPPGQSLSVFKPQDDADSSPSPIQCECDPKVC
jgi:hypothetical protein